MNNKAHLRPQDYDSNGDIIPMACKEEKGDLISREALKKALKSNCDLCHDKNTNWCEHCCPLNDFEDLIDNAPTAVDIKGAELAYNNGYSHAKKEFQRPQGEWIFLGDNPNRDNPNQSHSWSCNKCGRGVKEQENFCPNCGADMKGGAE